MVVAGSDPLRVCRCGHHLDTHEHYRRGLDCARCDCRAFMPVVRWRWRRAPEQPDPDAPAPAAP